ncbi:MAG: hypothetical protein PHT12_05565 [Patescibacteria group bacterium]|nr:hypothetical protein [Patescibacteria group bacterium]
MKRLQKHVRQVLGLPVRAVAPFITETAAAIYPAVLVFAVLTVVAEAVWPGVVTNVFSPRGIALVVVLSGALAAVFPATTERKTQLVRSAALAVPTAIGAAWTAWYHFVDSDERGVLTFLVGVVTAAVFWAVAGRPRPTEKEKD